MKLQGKQSPARLHYFQTMTTGTQRRGLFCVTGSGERLQLLEHATCFKRWSYSLTPLQPPNTHVRHQNGRLRWAANVYVPRGCFQHKDWDVKASSQFRVKNGKHHDQGFMIAKGLLGWAGRRLSSNNFGNISSDLLCLQYRLWGNCAKLDTKKKGLSFNHALIYTESKKRFYLCEK